jgi:hypothetical protein
MSSVFSVIMASWRVMHRVMGLIPRAADLLRCCPPYRNLGNGVTDILIFHLITDRNSGTALIAYIPRCPSSWGVIELLHQWLASVLEQFNRQAGAVKRRKLWLEVRHIQSADLLRGRGTIMWLVAKITRSYLMHKPLVLFVYLYDSIRKGHEQARARS